MEMDIEGKKHFQTKFEKCTFFQSTFTVKADDINIPVHSRIFKLF